MNAKTAAALILATVLVVAWLNIFTALGAFESRAAPLSALLDRLLEWPAVAAGLGAGFGNKTLDWLASLTERVTPPKG